MFSWKQFKSHSGKSLNWKIECDSLNRWDITALSEIIASRFKFYIAYCPPTNSIFVRELTRFLNHYHSKDAKTILIVDDVFDYRQKHDRHKKEPDRTRSQTHGYKRRRHIRPQ